MMRISWFLLLLCCGSFAEKSRYISFMRSYLNFDPSPKIITAFLCWNYEEIFRFHKTVYDGNYMLTILDPEMIINNSTLEVHDIPEFTPLEFNFYILDTCCPNFEDVLKIANDMKKFSAPYKWLILTSNFSAIQDMVSGLSIFPDGNVIFSEKSEEFNIKDAYRIDKKSPMIIKEINKWSESKGFQNNNHRILSKERINLRGKLMYVATYFPNNLSIEHIWDYRDKHINTISKMNVLINNIEIDYLNVTRNFIFTNSWGYKRPNSTQYDGIVGELQQGSAELGGVIFLTPDRFQCVDYLTLFTPSRGAFIFRKPPLSYVYNIFTLPFSRMVWISSFSLLVLMIIIVYFVVHIEWRQDPESQKHGVQDSLSDVTLMTVGYMCMQGSTREPMSPGGRTAMLFGSIALMFLYVSYSANIVSLLQSTADTINTFEDLLDSGLTLGTEDTVYNRYYFPRMTGKTKKAIYDRKIGPPGQVPHFHDMTYGMKRVREGFYAFHCERGVGYKVISDMFYEEEKCGLMEIINFIEVVDPWYTMRKNSPYKEIVRVGLKKIGDYGLNARELQRLYTKKPECITGGTNFVSVGIIDVYGAFLMLIAGGTLSIFILVVEILIKYRNKKLSK